MKPLNKPVTLLGTLGTKTFSALIDPNAEWSLIRRDEAIHIAPPTTLAIPITVKLDKITIQIDEAMVSEVKLNGHRMYGTFIIVPKLTEELIIGADFLQSWKIKLDQETEEIVIDPSALQLQLI